MVKVLNFLATVLKQASIGYAPKAACALRDKIREKTLRNRSGSMEDIIVELNPMLRGWFNYFKHAYRTEFKSIDGFIRRRLRAILLRRNKRKGWGKSIQAHTRWRNAYFAKIGLFTMHEARLSLCQSRLGNNRLESRVRENRMHGSEGGEVERLFLPLSRKKRITTNASSNNVHKSYSANSPYP